jgi:multiple sugar transport system permease protein
MAETHLPVAKSSWTPPKNDPQYDLWCRFKDFYRKRMIERGDYVCRTMPVATDGGEAELLDGMRKALAVQFIEHGRRDFFLGALDNYRLVGQYLFMRGRAFFNTILLVLFSVTASLIVNPLAAYALSRFRMKGTEKVILFLLATMAFPSAVTAIPGFLLIRDLGLLNTIAALVLPTVASGMSIFILKGFFDALPRELYEAAAIDGAGEWTVFSKITLPMTTPILAVNALNHFIAAYNSWEWAFLVCQKESQWTIAVWMYQMSQEMAGQPWCVMAGFVLVSIPTALVFLLCQKVILRGIVLPSMK